MSAENFKAFSARIQRAKPSQLRALGNSLDRCYNANLLNPSEFKRLDETIVSRIVQSEQPRKPCDGGLDLRGLL